MYQIQARVIYNGNSPEGWESSGRDCPTFQTEASSHLEAARKGADTLNPYRIADYSITLSVMSLEDPAREVVIFRHVNGVLARSVPAKN